jgi:hypothetical protein
LQAEALFGAYVEQREYVLKKARIPIIPDKSGHTHIEVTVRQFRQAVTRKLLWQAREGASIQNAGRARAGLRGDASPLHIHRWSDLPVPELGTVEPSLLGRSGCWARRPDAGHCRGLAGKPHRRRKGFPPAIFPWRAKKGPLWG